MTNRHEPLNRMGRALALYFRLNADRMKYTPLSHHGRRAAQLMPRIRARYCQE